MEEMKNLFKFLFLITLAICLSGLSLNCKKQPTESPTPSPSVSQTSRENNLTNLDPTSAVEEIKSNLNTAKQKAVLWQNDAILYSASAKITPMLQLQDVIEIYSFGSGAQPSSWWTISISDRSKNYIRAVIPKEDYLGSSLTPVAEKYWQINFIEAFQIAEKNGGKEWREKLGNNNYQITATLAHGDPKGYLYWTVEYQNSDGSDEKRVQINASNGEVVNQEI